jgi:hypothetical protein
MKLFGSIGELVSLVFRLAGGKEVRVTSAAQTGGEAGVTPVEIEIPDVGAGGSDVLVTEAASQALTNKTIDASANSISNLDEGNFETKLADANKALVRDAAGDVTSALITNANVDAAAAIAESKLDLDYPTSSLNSAIDGKLDNFTSANDSRIVLTDGTSGDALKESAVVINGLGQMSGVARLDVDNVRVDGNTISSTDANGPITLEAAGTATVKGVGGDVILDATDDAVQIKAANVLVRDGAEIVLYDESDVNALTLSVPAALTSSKSVAFPDLAGTVALTSGAQVITDKDIDGGTASDTSRITLPKAAKSALDALSRKEATLVYASDEDKVYVDDGSNLIPVGSDAAGSGEKTYIENPSASVVITGWTNVGDLDVARTSTASDLPREYTTGTGIKITADANTQSTADYVYYDFTLDDVDLNKKLKIQWAQKQTGSYVAGNLAVVITTQADRTTALHTPETTNIPAYDGVFQTSFDSGSTATLSLVIRATTDMATGAGIVISDVIVGPGQIQAVPAVGYLGELSGFTVSNNGSKAFTIGNKCWRIANFLRCQFSLDGNSTASGSGLTTTFTLNLPAGYTIDFSALAEESGTSSYNYVGTYTDYGVSGSAVYTDSKQIRPASTTSLSFYFGSGLSTQINIGSLNVARDMDIQGEFIVPIAEWAGAPNYAGQNDVEYVYNTGASTTADDTSSFAYGPSGTAILAFTSNATGQIARRVRFQTSIQATDKVWVEVNILGEWVPSATIIPRIQLNTVRYGIGLIPVTGNDTDLDVVFGKAGATPEAVASYGGNNGDPWSNYTSYKWRVVKAKAGAAVGFGAASDTSLGLVKATSTIFSVSLSGPVSISGTWRVARSGNVVTLSWPQMITSGASSATAITVSLTNMPSWARPFISTSGAVFTRDNGIYGSTPSFLSIPTSGDGTVQKTYASSAFTSSTGLTGLEVGSISYVGAAW